MRFLFPLFLAGAAVALVPILLHMARRRTRRQVPFSSLMFLTASPPRFERRQRIEEWALLALRCLVLVLLAAAFARPFLPRPAPALAVGTGERLVVLVDTSASMRRASLWPEALARARTVLERAGSADKVAIIAFDRRPRTLLGFEGWAAQAAEVRVSLAAERLAAQAPGWEGTDLGRALVAAAEAIVDDEGDAPGASARVVLISDLQEGSRLEALGISDWPARIELRVEALDAGAATNVALQALPEVGSEQTAARVRVTAYAGAREIAGGGTPPTQPPPAAAAGGGVGGGREETGGGTPPTQPPPAAAAGGGVGGGRKETGGGTPPTRPPPTAAAGGGEGSGLLPPASATGGGRVGGGPPPVWLRDTTARIRWSDGGTPVEVKLPAGQTRVIEAPQRGSGGEAPGTLVLDGDGADFDNRLHLAPPIPARVNILYLGADGGTDPQQPLFYLRRAFPLTRLRAPELTVRRPDGADLRDEKAAQLAVVTAPLGPRAVTALRAHLARGRTVLVALDDVAVAGVLEALAGVTAVPATEARSDGYALLTEVNLTHPILAPFADARFGDFTKIRFWKHRRLDEKRLPGARTVARFDDGSPAWVVVPAGGGSLFVMTAGWQPADSQLALSTKFVPLLHGILEASAGLDSGQAQFFVGDPVTLPAPEGDAGERRVRKPDGKVVSLAAGSAIFSETDLPGLYALESVAGPRVFAVNLDPAESATTPMPPESLERLGLMPGRAAVAASGPAPARENAFLLGVERDQRLWRWLLVAAIAAVLLETLVATRASRRTA